MDDKVLRKAWMLLAVIPASTPRRYIAFEMVGAITRLSASAMMYSLKIPCASWSVLLLSNLGRLDCG